MRRAAPLYALFLLSTLSFACASHTRLPSPARAALNETYAGKVMALRQSCYWGDLYDENEKWLLEPYAFNDVYHIVNLDGDPIHPTGQRGIAPAGSVWRIKRIEFPDVAALSRRMLTTPRYNPWVYLEPAQDNPLEKSRDYVLLLPMELPDQEAIETALGRLLGPENEVREWMSTRRPSIRVGIEHKEAVPGMTASEMVAALGHPRRWLADQISEKEAKVAWYPSLEVWLVNGVVEKTANARRLKPAPPAESPQEPESTAPEKAPANPT